MVPKKRKSSAQARELEERVFQEGKAQLDGLLQQLVDTQTAIKERLYHVVEDFKTSCQRMVEERAQIIEVAAAQNATAARYLDRDKYYHISVPERAMWVHGGVLIIYSPEDEEPGPDNVPDRILTLPSENVQQPRSPSAPTCLDWEEIAALPAHTIPPLRPSPLQASKDSLTFFPTPTSPLTSRAARPGTARPQLSPYTASCNWGLQPPIKMAAAKHYWVFDYRAADDGTYLFILRCPAEGCQGPVFNRHPLKQDRAVKHLKACGVQFKGEKDLVRRYAQQVIPGRRDREVTQQWAHRHNLKLLAANEKHLEDESI